MEIVPKGDLSPRMFCLCVLGRIPPSHVTSLNYHVIFADIPEPQRLAVIHTPSPPSLGFPREGEERV